MSKSMTGFGKAESELENKKIIVEIKTLNSRQVDLNTRMPNVYRHKELEIRNLLSERLRRGKIELNIHLEQTGDSSNFTLNKALAKKYYEEVKELAEEINLTEFENYLPIVLKMPEVLKAEKEDVKDEEWKILESTIAKAIIRVDEFRIREGTNLQKDISQRVHKIMELLLQVESFEAVRIDQIKSRIQKNLSNLPDTEIDQNRFEQELIYYLEKIDITEEKVRLKQHCDYFLETIEGKGSLGKKLGFISQEIGREVNTLGSKANEVNIQKIVIQMKDELEKIKEQLFNIL